MQTRECHRSAWISAATEPCGGRTALNSLPLRTRLFAIETTTLPARRSACSWMVGIAEPAWTASTTTSASHAPALSHGARPVTRVPHFATSASTAPFALSTAREPKRTW